MRGRAFLYELGNKWFPPAYSGGEAPHLLYSRAVLTIYDSGPEALPPPQQSEEGLKIRIEKNL